MTAGVEAIVRARRDASAARARMTASLAEVRARAAPKALAQRAISRVVRKSVTAADDGLAFAERRPATIAAVLATALLVFFRAPIADAVAGLIDKATRRPDPALDEQIYPVTPQSLEDAS